MNWVLLGYLVVGLLMLLFGTVSGFFRDTSQTKGNAFLVGVVIQMGPLWPLSIFIYLKNLIK